MQLEALIGVKTKQLEKAIQDKRVILFSARLRSRNAALAAFINEPGGYLYTLSHQDTTLHEFLTNLTAQLSEQAERFGTQTTQALKQRKTTPQELAEAFAADLSKARPAVNYLVFDEFDRLPHDADVAAFFETLAKSITGDTRLVINGRSLYFFTWNALIQEGIASVVGEDQALDGGIFNPETLDKPHLEVYGFGTGKVFVNGVSVDTWDGPLPRHLFYYFVDHPTLTRDEIFETFWPTLSVKEATNVFHVTKRKISERLGYELTSYSGGFYRPSDQINIHYDVANFEACHREGQTQPDETAISNWYCMIKLYRSEFLHTYDMSWIRERREILKQQYVESLIGVAKMYQAMNETDQAIHFFQRALREVPHREDVHRSIISIFHNKGQNEKAIAQYQLLEDILKRTLKITPSVQTQDVYNMILNAVGHSPRGKAKEKSGKA